MKIDAKDAIVTINGVRLDLNHNGIFRHMTLRPLYKKTSTGADQVWKIRTEGNVIITTWGQLNGKMQETRDVIAEGKNIGKKNETTAAEQAELEAESQWEKKKKKGYVVDLKDAREGLVDEVIEGGVFPMLAHKYSEHGDKIKFPAFVQPKLDGHRCIAVIKNGKATLWSRTRKPITGLPHVVKALEELAAKHSVLGYIFDGELYHTDYKDRFEELTSFIRNPEPKEGYEIVQYHIYDVVDFKSDFSERTSVLANTEFKEPLVFVETREVQNEEELMEAFEGFLKQGYEGAMVRNSAGLYVNKRSHDIQKLKEMLDDEFEIVGVEAGRGKMADKAIFVCKTKDGVEFKAKMKGSLDELRKYVDNPGLAIGKQLTVQYQGITGKSKVPRFPVGLRLREDI